MGCLINRSLRVAKPSFPSSYKRKELAHLKSRHASGASLTQEEMDKIHLEDTNSENLSYWKRQVQIADDDNLGRIKYCQAHVRNICANLHAKEIRPDIDHPMNSLLEQIFTEAEQLPSVHSS